MQASQGKELPIFPVILREYHCDVTHNTDKVIEFLSTYPSMQSNLPEGVITSRPDIHTIKDDVSPEVDQLFGFFEQCLREYRSTYKLYCDSLDITLAWSNHAPAGSGFGHPLHRHPMSYLSAVYYLTDGAPTFFDDPCTPRVTDTLDVWYHDKMESEWGINEKVDAEPGKLILFPAWLRHYSGRQTADYDRWTISFNAFPTGQVNVGPWDLPQLNVKL
nr:Putative 2OG-Fe(II) oxygenase [uncultured Mediterranean phage uvMED]|tara:strand:- start:7022 stop:7675 length:654 start_codon:yes stop_codon:yes gene_type:complete